MDVMTTEDREFAPVRQLARAQRRVLGSLLEKAFTTPESYPLTLKATTTACNQKSNRDPVTNYSEDAVLQALDELREMGVVGVLVTDTGRTERYRHYMRKRFTFTEPQLAIVAELLLRGRQQLGELRARASRMVPIESLDDLRRELSGLIEQGYVQATGPLERRGVDVDHTFYLPDEGHRLEPRGEEPEAVEESAGAAHGSASSLAPQLHELRIEVEQLREHQQQLRDELDELKRTLGI